MRPSVREHWCRVEMYRHAVELFRRAAPSLDVLEFSGTVWGDLLPWASYTPVYGVDVCYAPVVAEMYDLVILDQVLEHVRAPAEAIANARRLLRPGGQLFVSTPFLIRYHPDPIDLWRWTAPGLAQMLKWQGLRDVEAWSWGNAQCVRANLHEWAIVPPGGPGENDERFPVTVWAVGTR
jgi:SAM-dependent methyltransferase